MKSTPIILACLALFFKAALAQTGIRLAGGSDECRGQLEIMTIPNDTSSYFPACSSIANDNEAKVVCRMIPDCPSTNARRVSPDNFDVTVAGNSTLIPFKYVCNGEESDFSSCYLSTGQVCRQSDNALTTIAIECDTKTEVNLFFVIIVAVIVVIFIALPIITYSCIKVFEWLDYH